MIWLRTLLSVGVFMQVSWCCATHTVACEGPFKDAARYQQTMKRWVNLYAVRPIENRGEVDFVAVGETYYVALTHNTSVNMEGGYSLTFPTPLLSVSAPQGVFGKFYSAAMDILAEEYTVGAHPMPHELGPIEKSHLQHAQLQETPRQIFYFTKRGDQAGKASALGAFVDLFDTTPIEGDAPLTALERRLDWRHPDRDKPNHVIVELRRGHVGRGEEIHELQQSAGLMRKVATYIDQYHLSQGRSVTIINLTFDKLREQTFKRFYGFEKIDVAHDQHPSWRVMQVDGAAFLQRFGSDRETIGYHLGYRESGLADPLFHWDHYAQTARFLNSRHQKQYLFIRDLIGQGHAVADAAGPPITSLEQLGTFTEYVDGLFEQQRDHMPMVWF